VLEELIYNNLGKGEIPKIKNTKSFFELRSEKFNTRIRTVLNVSNTLALIRPLSITKPISINKVSFSGYRNITSRTYMIKPGDQLVFEVTYKNNERLPVMAKLEQSMADVKDVVNVLFMPQTTYVITQKKSITKPTRLMCSATASAIARSKKIYDAVTQTYPIGLYDDRYKPVSEYPVSGVDNAILDIAYNWKVQNTVYPTPVPSGITIDTLSLTYYSGFIDYEGKKYKDPTKNNTIKVKARIVNNTGYSLTLSNYGLILSTLYEDNRHVSQAVVDVGSQFSSISLSDGAYYIYELSVNLPTWAYGRVAIAHAINFIRGNTLFWTGGPFYCFEVFRLRLP